MKRKLRLSRNRKLFGVCGGFAEYFDVDPAIVRILMIVAILCSCGYAAAFYVLCAIFIDRPSIQDHIRPNNQYREEPPEIPQDNQWPVFNPNETYIR